MLPFTARLYRRVTDGSVDGHNNARFVYAGEAVEVPCFWWTPDSTAPDVSPVRSATDRLWCVKSGLATTVGDKVVFGDGDVFLVDGGHREWDSGPYGFAPNRWIIPLKQVRPT